MLGRKVCIISFSVLLVWYPVTLENYYADGQELSLQWSELIFPQHHDLTWWLMTVEVELGKKLQNWICILTARWGKPGRDYCAVWTAAGTTEDPLKPRIKGSPQDIVESLTCCKPMLWTTGLGFAPLTSASPFFLGGLCWFSGCCGAESAILELWNRRHHKRSSRA